MRIIRQSLRILMRNPGVSSIAVLSLVTAITLNAVIFSVVDWLWLQPAPYASPDEIVRLYASSDRVELGALSWPDFLEVRAGVASLADVAAYQHRGASLFGEEYSVELLADVVSRNFFTVLGVDAGLGNVFAETDPEELQAEPMVVLSHSLWQRHFGADPGIIGQSIRMTGRTRTVLGIAPEGFYGVSRLVPVDVWFPEETWGYPEERSSRTFRDFYPIGRLAPGATPEVVQAEAEALFRNLDLVDFSSGTDQRALVLTERELQNRSSAAMGTLLLAIVGAFLLIACANVSGLLLARAIGRQREMAIRLAVGANRRHLIRQMLTEGILLAGAAALLSLLLAGWIIRIMPALMPPMPVYVEWGFALDARTVLFALVLAFLTAGLTVLFPALHASRPDLIPSLKGEPGSPGRRSGRLAGMNLLVIGQLALSFMLITSTCLLTRSFARLQAIDPGFRNTDLLVAEVYPPGGREATGPFCADLLDRVRTLPGVEHATIARHVPFFPSGGGATRRVFVPGSGAGWEEEGRAVKFNIVEPEYFATLDIPLLQGRRFADTDAAGGTPVMIVNETMARSYWPGENPLGKSVILNDPTGPAVEVVGIVPDGRYNNVLEDPAPYFYLPFGQLDWWDYLLIVESGTDPLAMAEPVRRQLRAMNSTIDIYPMTTLRRLVRDTTYEQELIMWLTLFFAGLGVLLAGVGLYGTISYAVTRRTREIGVRQALGADRSAITGLIVRYGVRLLLPGVVAGGVLTIVAGRLMESLLFGVRSVDPLSLAVALLLLVGVVGLATILPGRRAGRVDPLVAIRSE